MAFNFSLPQFNLPKLDQKKPVTPQVNPNPFAGLGGFFKKAAGFLNPRIPASSNLTANATSSMLPKLDFSKDSIVSSVTDPFKSYLGGQQPTSAPITPATSPQTQSQQFVQSFNPPVIPQVRSTTPQTTPTSPTTPVSAFPGGVAPTEGQYALSSAPIAPSPDSLTIPEGTSSNTVVASQSGGSPSGSQVSGIDPTIQSAYDKSTKAYEDALKLSPDELSTQEDLDNVISSARQAYVNIENKPIPMQFITGQQAAIERRANVLAEPLERKLARLQAARTATLDASKFALERSENRMKEERSRAEGKVVGDSILRFNPSTGKYDVMFNAKDNKPVTLSAGASLVDPITGKVIFTAPKEISTQVVESGNRKILINSNTGETIKDLGAVPLTATERENAAAKVTAESEKSQASLGTANLINQLLQGDFKSITGGPLGQSLGTRFGVANQKEVNLFKNIKAQLDLGARQLIKGSGAISDFESRTLSEAASMLGRNLSNSSFQEALIQSRGALMSNAGQPVKVEIFDQSGKSQGEVVTTREGIGQAIKDGLVVKFK